MTESADEKYLILGVDADASEAELKTAYRTLIRSFHPDVNPDPRAVEKFKNITNAYRHILEVRGSKLNKSIWDSFIIEAGENIALISDFEFDEFIHSFEMKRYSKLDLYLTRLVKLSTCLAAVCITATFALTLIQQFLNERQKNAPLDYSYFVNSEPNTPTGKLEADIRWNDYKLGKIESKLYQQEFNNNKESISLINEASALCENLHQDFNSLVSLSPNDYKHQYALSCAEYYSGLSKRILTWSPLFQTDPKAAAQNFREALLHFSI